MQPTLAACPLGTLETASLNLKHAQANSTSVREEGGDVLDDMVSAPKQIVVDYLTKHFPLVSEKLCDSDIDGLIHQVALRP